MNASIKDTKFQWHDIKKWDCVIWLKSLSKKLCISIQNIRTSLNHLKSTHEITIKSTNRFSIITVVKYSDYQYKDNNNQHTHQHTHQQTTNKQLTTLEEDKKIKNNIINNNIYITPEKKYLIENFIDKQKPQIAYQIKKQWEDEYLNKQVRGLDLLEKDGFTLETIQTVLSYIKQNEFRSKNIMSITKLREKDKNGIPYIVRMIWEIQQTKPKILNLD